MIAGLHPVPLACFCGCEIRLPQDYTKSQDLRASAFFVSTPETATSWSGTIHFLVSLSPVRAISGFRRLAVPPREIRTKLSFVSDSLCVWVNGCCLRSMYLFYMVVTARMARKRPNSGDMDLRPNSVGRADQRAANVEFISNSILIRSVGRTKCHCGDAPTDSEQKIEMALAGAVFCSTPNITRRSSLAAWRRRGKGRAAGGFDRAGCWRGRGCRGCGRWDVDCADFFPRD